MPHNDGFLTKISARASATSEKQNTAQRGEESASADLIKTATPAQRARHANVTQALALMALDSGTESMRGVEHSNKKLALGNGASPTSSLTTKSETEDGDSQDYSEHEDEGEYEDEADSEENDECNEAEETSAMRPKRAASSPIKPDFGPRAATRKHELFDPSDRGATRSAPIKQIQRK